MKGGIKDEFFVWTKLKDVVDTAENYAGWFGKTVNALLNFGAGRAIDEVKLEVTFSVEDGSGGWISDNYIEANRDGGCPNQILIDDWTNKDGLHALFEAYKSVMIEAAKEINKEAMKIYKNTN